MANYLELERCEILERALKYVPDVGWTRHALTSAAYDGGYEISMAQRAFPRGMHDLVKFYCTEVDRYMCAGVTEEGLKRFRIRERIEILVRGRLELPLFRPEIVRKTLAYYSNPGQTGSGVNALYRTIDAMWRLAGDDSTDFNFYTKRILLAGVYTSTLLYWLDDTSTGHIESWAFLNRRISNVMKIQKTRAHIDRLASRLIPSSKPVASGNPDQSQR